MQVSEGRLAPRVGPAWQNGVVAEPNPAERPLANVERTVGWILGHLSGDALERFESELPRWDANHQGDLGPAGADAAVRDLDHWLRSWIEQAKA